MPYFKNNDVNILLIHIPKTGGTSVECYFSYKFDIQLNNKSLSNFLDIPLNNINSSLQHITYNQILQYNNVFNVNFDNIKILTIVRNPYTRFVSDLFWHGIINMHTSLDDVFQTIQKYIVASNYDNHNIPQYIFITDDDKNLIPDIHILHTETLNNDMHLLGYTDFDIIINNNPPNINYYNFLNKNSIELINEFYHLDFILFNYDKII
jgi:hypothetical protein